jgi:CRP-like cAMP-binding protein
VLIAARPPLVAFNLELGTHDIALAKAIASRVREQGGGLPGVRAIAVKLERQETLHVSTNIQDPFQVPLRAVVERVRQEAELEGVRVVMDRREADTDARPVPDRRTRAITLDLEALGFAIVPASRPAVPRAGSAAPATIAVLRMLEVFRAFSAEEIEALASRMTWRALQAGQLLFREGEVGNEMYFVLSGRLLISKTVARNVDKVLTRMGPGDFFGEMNLFGGLQRSATVQAEVDTELLVLDRDTLTAVVERNPQAGLAFFTALVREFSQRLSATDDLVGEVTRWGLEASGFDLSEDRRPTKMAPEPSLEPSDSAGDQSTERREP